jgi:hypothetical protein
MSPALHCNLLLLCAAAAAGLQGLAAEAGRMQQLGCRAQLQATQHGFMLLSRALTSWQQQVALRKRLDIVSDTLQVNGDQGRACCSAVL